MPSQKNTEYLEKTKDRLKEGKAFYFTDFTGLSVKNLEELRKELTKTNGNYLVLKNTIGYLAMKELGFDEKMSEQLFKGPTGIAIAFDDPIEPAKVVTKHENLKIKGSFIEGRFFGKDDVIKFAKIPSKVVLYSQLVGSINLLGNLVNVFEGIIRDLISTLEAVQKKEAK